MMINWMVAVGLFILGAADFATKKVSLIVIGIWGIFGAALQLYLGELFCMSRIIAILPGILLFLLARVSGEKIGYGDAWTILVMGIYMDVENLIAVGMIAITLSGLAALVLICICKKKRDYEMPFIPFVFAGYMAEQILFTALV